MYLAVNDKQVFCSNGTGEIRAEKPAVIFLHGAGMDHSIWVLPARHFARKGFNVFAVDLPGHGRSSGPALASIGAITEWLHRLVAILKLSKPAIVGHSMGSLIAINYAAQYPDSLRALAVLGTSIPMPVSDSLLLAARNNSHDAIDMANTWSHSNSARLGGNDLPGINMMMSGQRLLERTGDDVFYTDLNACNEFSEAAELAKNISVETLVIIGEQDKMTAAANALGVAKNIKHCSVTKLSPCGHAMLSEQPNKVLDALITIV